jgi:hypothetical protein
VAQHTLDFAGQVATGQRQAAGDGRAPWHRVVVCHQIKHRHRRSLPVQANRDEYRSDIAWRSALAICREVNVPGSRAQTRHRLGEVLFRQRRYDRPSYWLSFRNFRCPRQSAGVIGPGSGGSGGVMPFR